MIEELLSQLRLMGALNCYKNLKDDNFTKEQLLITLLKSEVDWKSENKMKSRLRTASFPYEKDWAHLQPNKNPKIPFNKIMKFSDGKFVQTKRNICFIGAPGLGKTHSLIAIGKDLCRLGFYVKFYTAINLVTKLEEAKEENRLSKFMEKIMRPHLLIIDELGFVPLSNNGSRLLFDVFSKRYEAGSIAVSTNLSLPKWGETFGSIELTTALLDRFTHKCDIFTYEGESFRFQESRKK